MATTKTKKEVRSTSDVPDESDKHTTPNTSCVQHIFHNPRSYFLVICIGFIYSIVLMIMEWDSNCYGISQTFIWKYYLLTTIGLFMLYFIYLITLSMRCCRKHLSKPMLLLSVQTCFANAILLLLWIAYGFIDWFTLYQNYCANNHVLIGYVVILCIYWITCMALCIQQCISGIQQYRKRMQQKRYIQSQNMENNSKSHIKYQVVKQNTASPQPTDVETFEIPEERLKQFVEEFNYFDGLDFSRSTLTILSEPAEEITQRPNTANVSPNMPTLDETQSHTVRVNDIQNSPLTVPKDRKASDSVATTDSFFKSKSFSDRFLGEATEMSSTMFLNYNKDEDDNCVCMICLEAFEAHDSIGKLMCNHIFHKQCIYSWLKKNATCPLCREDVEKFANVPFL